MFNSTKLSLALLIIFEIFLIKSLLHTTKITVGLLSLVCIRGVINYYFIKLLSFQNISTKVE